MNRYAESIHQGLRFVTGADGRRWIRGEDKQGRLALTGRVVYVGGLYWFSAWDVDCDGEAGDVSICLRLGESPEFSEDEVSIKIAKWLARGPARTIFS